VRLPIVDDLLRRDGPDSRQGVELLGRRRVEIDGSGRHGPGAGSRSSAACRHEHLLAVGKRCGEVDEVELGSLGRASRTGDRVGNPRPLRQPVEPGTADRARNVDDERRGAGARRRFARADERRRRAPRRRRT
jgi:hypothetical protein